MTGLSEGVLADNQTNMGLIRYYKLLGLGPCGIFFFLNFFECVQQGQMHTYPLPHQAFTIGDSVTLYKPSQQQSDQAVKNLCVLENFQSS